MVLVYNFSNSNVEYSLQWMSEHIELMGQLSSITVKVPRVSRDLPASPQACCHPQADSETPSRPVPTVQHPSPSGLYAPDDSSPPSLAGGVAEREAQALSIQPRDPHPGQPAPEGPWTRTRQRLLTTVQSLGAQGKLDCGTDSPWAVLPGPSGREPCYRRGDGRGLPPLLQTVL